MRVEKAEQRTCTENAMLKSIYHAKKRNAGKAAPKLACSCETDQNSAVRQPSKRSLPHGSVLATGTREKRIYKRR
jgi:hypothetical protein